jgi:hypothetical protein
MPKKPDPTPPNPIDDILGLLGRAVNAANGASNAVVRRAQGTPIYGGKTREKSGYAVEDAIGTVLDTLTNVGTDITHGAHDADWARGRSHKGKIGGRTVDELGQYPSGGNWHHPEQEAGLSGVINDAMRRMHSGANTIDMQIVQPIKRTIAENDKRKEDRKKEKADLAINTQRKSVERLPNGLIMTTFEQRKTPAYPSGGNWFDPESESGLAGLITNAKRSMNSRNSNTKKRGSVQKANWGEMAANAGKMAGRLGENAAAIARELKIPFDIEAEAPIIRAPKYNFFEGPGGQMRRAMDEANLQGTPFVPKPIGYYEHTNAGSGLTPFYNSRNPSPRRRIVAPKFDWLERMGLKGNPEFAQYAVSPAVRPKSRGYRGARPFDVEAEARPFTRFDENPPMRSPIVPELKGRTSFDIESEIAPRNMGFSDPDVYNGFTADEYKQIMDQFSPGASRLFENASPAYLAEIIRSMPEYPTFFPQSSSFTRNPASAENIKGFTLKRAVSKRAKKEPTCDCGEPISQCKCSGHNHTSMQKGGLCKCGSGMMKSMCKCGGMGKSMLKSDMCKCGSGMMKSMCKCGGMGKSMLKSDMCKCGSGMMKSMCKCGGMGKSMNKSMYKSMSGKMDADMAITPQKISANRSIKSSNKYFN